MGYRLSKIYTRKGDKGTTGLGNNTRVAKDHIRVEAYGTVDELNSAIGLILATNNIPQKIQETLIKVQHELFNLGGELCIPGMTMLEEQHTKNLETILDELNAELPPLEDFILPGGNIAAAHCHLARTICRRTERRVVSLMLEEEINQHGISYLNRLSDLLFVMARVLARQNGGQEVIWQHEINAK